MALGAYTHIHIRIKVISINQVYAWFKNPSASDVNNVNLTLQYLDACRDLFGEGFLSCKKITTMKSELVVSIHKSYVFLYQEMALKAIWWCV